METELIFQAKKKEHDYVLEKIATAKALKDEILIPMPVVAKQSTDFWNLKK